MINERYDLHRYLQFITFYYLLIIIKIGRKMFLKTFSS